MGLGHSGQNDLCHERKSPKLPRCPSPEFDIQIRLAEQVDNIVPSWQHALCGVAKIVPRP